MQDTAQIKFVYFDVGGVVINDFSGNNKWTEFVRDLGIMSDQDEEFEKFWEKYGPEVCVGRDIETLKPLIEKEFDVKFPPGYSLLIDGFVNRFEENRSIRKVFEVVRRVYKIGLLTNMYPGMFKEIEKRKILPDVKWNVVIDSSVAHIQKPDREIYRLAEEKAGAKGEEILFVENSTTHVHVAKKFGWRTFLSPFAKYLERKLEDESEEFFASEGFRSRRSEGRRYPGRKPVGASYDSKNPEKSSRRLKDFFRNCETNSSLSSIGVKSKDEQN